MSAFTRQQLDSFLAQAKLAQAGEISLTQLEGRSRNIDSQLGKAAEEIKKSGPFAIFTLAMLIFFLESCNVNIDINRLIDQFMASQGLTARFC